MPVKRLTVKRLTGLGSKRKARRRSALAFAMPGGLPVFGVGF
jgi:hypothetical protein